MTKELEEKAKKWIEEQDFLWLSVTEEERLIKAYEAGQKDSEAQIEKMKCCYNCSKWYDGECEESPKSKTFFYADFKCDNWEIADD